MKLVEYSFVASLGLLVACSEKAQVTPAADSAPKPATTGTQAATTNAPAATVTPSAAPTPAPAAKSEGFTCRVKSSGASPYSGPCDFKAEGGNGSFSITPVGEATIGGATVISVSILEKGNAEVRGLTKDGVNSRWGEAKRSDKDKACWTGSDFEVCAYAGKGPSASGSNDPSVGKAVAQKHGSEYWAVYTAKGATQDDPAVKASIEALKKRGFEFGKTFGFGSLGCDVGSAAALKAPDDTNAVAVYFANEADAKEFAPTVTPPALAIVKIKAMCRD